MDPKVSNPGIFSYGLNYFQIAIGLRLPCG